MDRSYFRFIDIECITPPWRKSSLAAGWDRFQTLLLFISIALMQKKRTKEKIAPAEK